MTATMAMTNTNMKKKRALFLGLVLVALFPSVAFADLRGASDKDRQRRLDTTFQKTTPTKEPTSAPNPTKKPTDAPTNKSPTSKPTKKPTEAPEPTNPPTKAPTLPPWDLPPLCSSLEIVPDDSALNVEEEYSNGYTFKRNTKSGMYFSKSVLSGRFTFQVTRKCEYRIRHYDSWKYHTVATPTEFFQAMAVTLNGNQMMNGAYFTGYAAPHKSRSEMFESEMGQLGCGSDKYCVGLETSCDAVGGNEPIIYEFSSENDRDSMKWLLGEAIKDGDRSKIFGTNNYLECGQPPICFGPDAKGMSGKFGLKGTCYVDPIYLRSDSCDKYEYKIEYKDSPTESFRDVFPWFNECCHTFECDRLEGSEYTDAANRFKYNEPSTSVKNISGIWHFRLSGNGISGGPIMWKCPSQKAAQNLRDFAERVKDANIFHQKGDESCTKDRIPNILKTPPMNLPKPDPVGPKCEDVEHTGVCNQLPSATCFIQPSSEDKCTQIEYVMQGASGTDAVIFDDILEWFGACIGGSGCSIKVDDGYVPGKLTYVDNPKFLNHYKSGKWWFKFMNRKTGGKNTLEGDKIIYECSKEGSFLAKEFAYLLADYNGWGNVFKGPTGKFNGYDLFKMEPTACDTASPTLSPTITASPTSSPSMSPTVCADSYLNAQSLNIALVIDLSFSTYATRFKSDFGKIGDVNGDGKPDTILDAEIKAVEELLSAIADEGTLNNDNSEIGLISFHTGAKFEGSFGTVGSEADRLMSHLKDECRTETSQQGIMDTNNGFTNFDAALDEAVEYFTNVQHPDRLNLLVFLSDGIPNVRGDGDDEEYCTSTVTFWNDDVAGKEYNCADLDLDPGQPFGECLSDDPQCAYNNAYQDCLRGPTKCESTEALAAVANYSSEIASLNALGVARLAIGVGEKSNVKEGEPLWMIDDNPAKHLGVLPLQVMTTDELSSAVSNLCILNTDGPTGEPSVSPSYSPTISSVPSMAPSSVPSSAPSATPSVNQPPSTAEPSFSPSESPSSVPSAGPSNSPSISSAPSHKIPDCFDGAMIISKDSTGSYDDAECAYNDEMIEVLSMDSTTVRLQIKNTWANIPNAIKIFEHGASADELIDGSGFSCSDPAGKDIFLASTEYVSPEDTAEVKCYASMNEYGSVTMLAVIELVIVDSSSTAVPTCDSSPSQEGVCSWRFVIPCSQESICTDGPSYTPSSSPSSVPTYSPTEYEEPDEDPSEDDEDDEPIILVGPEECPEDEVQVYHRGVTTLPPGAVEILSQDTSTVTVKVSQQWTTETVDFVYYQYAIDSFDNKCYAQDSVDSTWSDTITIYCSVHSQRAQLQLWLKDSSTGTLVDGDDAVVPNCCYPDETDANTVTYILEISCVPKCPTYE